jgi:diguanylate cyclase (GGDEF)-like protein
MTNATSNTLSKDGFWTRVRLALRGRTAAPVAPLPHSGGFEAALSRGWYRAAKASAPLTLMLIEIDELADYFTAYGAEAADACFAEVQETLTTVLPRADDACVAVSPGRFGVVLPELPPHVAQPVAAAMAQAVRRLGRPHKASHAGTVTVSMGLAVVMPEGTLDGRLVDSAQQALRRAQRRGIGRLEVVDLRPRQERQAA